VSHALPELYALSRTLQRYDCLRHRHWRWLCALSLSATYGVLLLLASLCVATGLFHVQAPHDEHHHHAGSDAHPHPSPDAHPAPPIPDICDLVHQVCTVLVLESVLLLTLMLPLGPRPVSLVHRFLNALSPSPYSIRAPPALIS
jgi:hypothetical protein